MYLVGGRCVLSRYLQGSPDGVPLSINCKWVRKGSVEWFDIDCAVGTCEAFSVGGRRVSGGNSFSQSK